MCGNAGISKQDKSDKAMTEQEATKRLTEIMPTFPNISPILQETAIAAFVKGYDEGYSSGFDRAADIARKAISNHQTVTP